MRLASLGAERHRSLHGSAPVPDVPFTALARSPVDAASPAKTSVPAAAAGASQASPPPTARQLDAPGATRTRCHGRACFEPAPRMPPGTIIAVQTQRGQRATRKKSQACDIRRLLNCGGRDADRPSKVMRDRPQQGGLPGPRCAPEGERHAGKGGNPDRERRPRGRSRGREQRFRVRQCRHRRHFLGDLRAGADGASGRAAFA